MIREMKPRVLVFLSDKITPTCQLGELCFAVIGLIAAAVRGASFIDDIVEVLAANRIVVNENCCVFAPYRAIAVHPAALRNDFFFSLSKRSRGSKQL